MRSRMIGILSLALLGVAAGLRREPTPLRPPPLPPRRADVPKPPLSDDTRDPRSPPVRPPPSQAQPRTEPTILPSGIPALGHSTSLERELGLLEKGVVLIRHHRLCARSHTPFDELRSEQRFSAEQRAFIEEAWKARDVQMDFYRQQVIELEDRYRGAVHRILTPEQQRIYLRLDSPDLDSLRY